MISFLCSDLIARMSQSRSHPKLPKKNRHRISVAGFTTRSVMPLVTTLGSQFIASTVRRLFFSASAATSLFSVSKLRSEVAYQQQSTAHASDGEENISGAR
jgi:hypothetical protein